MRSALAASRLFPLPSRARVTRHLLLHVNRAAYTPRNPSPSTAAELCPRSCPSRPQREPRSDSRRHSSRRPGLAVQALDKVRGTSLSLCASSSDSSIAIAASLVVVRKTLVSIKGSKAEKLGCEGGDRRLLSRIAQEVHPIYIARCAWLRAASPVSDARRPTPTCAILHHLLRTPQPPASHREADTKTSHKPARSFAYGCYRPVLIRKHSHSFDPSRDCKTVTPPTQQLHRVCVTTPASSFLPSTDLLHVDSAVHRYTSALRQNRTYTRTLTITPPPTNALDLQPPTPCPYPYRTPRTAE